MKGVIFNLLEDAVSESFGADVWDDLLDRACVTGAYTSLGDYPDAEISALVEIASTKLALPPSEVLRWFGRAAMPMLKQRYEGLFSGKTTSKQFILSVNSLIHPEILKLYPRSNCPFFNFSTNARGPLLIEYASPRRMCHLAQGFIEGAAELWADRVSVEHKRCVHAGAESCQLAVTWH